MARYIRDANGHLLAVHQDGSRTPVDISALDNAQPVNVLDDQQGVTLGQRFVVKNLTRDPDAAKAYLQHIGYDVRPYGGGFNFAVRKQGSTDPWKVVDPKGFDWQDILDFSSDAAQVGANIGAGIAAAPSIAATGPLGEAAVMGGTNAAFEAGRQALGSMAGVPDNMNGGDIALQGAVGAVAPGLTKVATDVTGSVVSRAGKMLRMVGATAAGFKGTSALPKETVLREAADALNTAKGSRMGAGFSVTSAGEKVRDAVRSLYRKVMPEEPQIAQLAAQAEQAQVPFDLSGAVDPLEAQTLEFKGERPVTTTRNVQTSVESSATRTARTAGKRFEFGPGGEISEFPFDRGVESSTTGLEGEGTQAQTSRDATTTRTVQEPIMEPRSFEAKVKGAIAPGVFDEAADALARIRAVVGSDNIRALPASKAIAVKRILQGIANDEGAFRGVPVSDQFKNLVVSAQHIAKQALEDTFSAGGMPEYVKLMRALDNKLITRADLAKAVQIGLRGPAGRQAGENFIRGIHGTDQDAYRRAIDGFQAQFGVDLRTPVRRAAVGAAIGEAPVGPEGSLVGGMAPTIPAGTMNRWTGVGAIAGSAMFGNAPAALSVATLFSPKAVLAMTRAGRMLGQLGSKVPDAATRAAALEALQEYARASGKGITSESKSARTPKRVTYLTGS